MINVPMNFKNTWRVKTCPLCKNYEGTTEHYSECTETDHPRRAYDVKEIKVEDPIEMVKYGNYMKSVETLLKL